MSRKTNRTCIVCGENYYYCSHNCADSINKPSWYTIFHDQNCHDIYDAVSNIYPVKGKEAAKIILDKLDLSNKENFHHNIIKLINEIYDINEDEKSKEIKETNQYNEMKEEKVNIKNLDIKEEVKSNEKQVTLNKSAKDSKSSIQSKKVSNKNSVGLKNK